MSYQIAQERIEAARRSRSVRLNLSGLGLDALPPELWTLTQLRVLWVSDNRLTALPPEVAALQGLERLRLDQNKLATLPPEFGGLSALRELRLGENQLNPLPPALWQLTQLRDLRLESNGITELPPDIARLQELQELLLGSYWRRVDGGLISEAHNRLRTLPVELGRLSQLQRLRLDNNQLTAVPKELGQLSQLQELWLDHNELTVVPKELGQLSQLQKLWLEDNQLTAVPVELGQLSQLQRLGLSNNQLTAVLKELKQLSQLQLLWLSHNQLTMLPVELGQLSQLRELWLNDNQLTTVPKELGQLSQLQELWLSSNQLTTVPKELGQLSQLQELWLSNNQLTTVPVELGQLSQLQFLLLIGNVDLKIPPEVEGEGAQAVLDLIRQGPQPHWASKMMLVGEGRHGKSSLLRALCGEAFDPNLDSTHGMRIGRLPLPHPRRAGIEMELSTWDFGGQQIYHTMHQFFLTDRSLYALVWDGQRRWEECKIEAWLEALALRAPTAPVLLVATHCPKDGRPADPPFAQLTETFPNLIPTHFTVDNQTGDGIAELRAQLIETAAGLPLMGELSPPAWTAVKEALRVRRQTEKACTLAALEDLIASHGITAEASQRRLIRFLNELGEIIHYPDNPVLRDTVILDAEWVSQTISLVLDSEDVQRGLGYFRRETMERI